LRLKAKSGLALAALLLPGICQPCAAAPAVPPVSLLGIVLGSEFSTLRCGPEPITGETCAEEKPNTNRGASSVHLFELRMPSADRPDYVELGGVIISVIAQRIEGVMLMTTGPDLQEMTLRDLTEKFGKPSSFAQRTVSNGFGAQFTYPKVLWKIGAAEILFDGLSVDFGAGEIIATTAKLRRQHVQDEHHKPVPHL
jgi:hypothetical protein